MMLSPENDALLAEALDITTARGLRAGARLVSRPYQITVEELDRLMNAARDEGREAGRREYREERY